MDPLVYDLKYAVDLLDNVRQYDRLELGDDDRYVLGESLPSLARLIMPADSWRASPVGN